MTKAEKATARRNEYWIVTNYKFHQHDSQELAEAERDRLTALVPGKSFRLLRVKRSLKKSDAHVLIPALIAALQEIEQRANESANGPLGERETIYAMHRIAVAALAKAGA